MPSPAQLAANRRNAQNSTGPRTPSGKAASRLNAMKSGLYADTLVIRGENSSDLERLTAEYHQEFRPVTARERDLVDTMVRNEWIVRRMGLVEAELWGHQFQHADSTIPGNRFDTLKRHFPLGQAFLVLSRDFERLQRRVSALERSTRCALQELAEIRREQSESAADDQSASEAASAPQPIESEATPQEIGFVPSNPVGAGHARPGVIHAETSELPPLPSPLIPDPRSLTPTAATAA